MGTLSPDQQRIRDYLQAQGAKLTPAQIVEKVRGAMGELRAAADAVPAARFDERPVAGEWSANEVLAHVVAAGRHFGGAIVRLIGGLPAGGVRDRLERDVLRHVLADWWSMLERDRAELFARVAAADPDARLEGMVAHPFFGSLNWREALLFMRLHDLDHAGQLQKIVAELAGERPA